jgi:RNA polymerase sigma-70 factor (ECF subfamily)
VTSRLAAIFRSVDGEGEVESVSDDPGLETALVAYVDAARGAWPDLDVGTEALVRHLAARTSRGKLPSAAHAGDLLLACACTRGVPPAIEAFHRHYSPVIARVLSRRRAPADVFDDAAQTVYERLLVRAADGPPEIADYRGVGALRGWVSSVTARTLLMLYRSKGRRREQQGDSGLVAVLATNADPELLYAREHYKKDMEGAITATLGRLGDRERTLLRLHLSERMTIDKLAAMYNVNRATAARWLAGARDAVVRGTRDELRERLRLDDRGYDSVVALIQSDFELSIARLLR